MKKNLNKDYSNLYGMVAFEEPGMPWTRVFGKVKLIRKEIIEAFGPEPHWLIEVDGEKHMYLNRRLKY